MSKLGQRTSERYLKSKNKPSGVRFRNHKQRKQGFSSRLPEVVKKLELITHQMMLVSKCQKS